MTTAQAVLSLRTRVLRAGSWSMGGYALNQVIRLATNLLMTRLLLPEVFGVMAIANMLILGLNLLSDIGHRQNIIQSKRGDDPAFLNTAWSVQILRGALIFVLTLLLSLALGLAARWGWAPAGSVYADPILPQIIAVLSLTALIAGFESTKTSTTYRSLALRPVALLEIYCQIIGAAVTFAWAAIDRSIWALVMGAIAGNIAKVLLSHFILRGHANRWAWEPTAVRELFHFGKWVFTSSLVGFFVNNGDRLLLGALVSPQVLGIYSIAFLLISSLQMALGQVIAGVAYPALSEVVRERPGQLKQTYYKLRTPLDSGMLLLAGFLLLTGDEIVGLLYDHRYADAGPMLQMLSITLVALRYQVADQCFLALGKPRLLMLLNMVRAAALYLLVPLGFHWFGFDGALGGIVLSYFASIPLSLYLKAKHGVLATGKELRVLPVFFVGVLLGSLLSAFE